MRTQATRDDPSKIAYSYKLVGIPNKSLVCLRVEFPPNGSTPPHRHGGANVGAYVLKGRLLNKMNDEPMKTIEEGGSWFEAPGCHHRISENASASEPATLITTMIMDTEGFERDGMNILIQIDVEYAEY
jgi:quercetin dioxygenase-like cupin family protein